MALIDGLLVLVICAGFKFTTTHPTPVTIRLYCIYKDIVGVVVVINAQPSAHNAILGYLSVEDHLNYNIQVNSLLIQGLVQFLGLGEVAGEAIKPEAVRRT